MKATDFASEAGIAHLVEIEAQEGLKLEFKGGRLFQQPVLDRSQKETLAATFASFANSDGGTLIVGVDCRKVERVDCAQALAPISRLAEALTQMTDLIGEALQPRHDGITVRAIPTANADGGGYLVVDVPRSERRPHMSHYQKSYYKRAGASKFQMEHYDVEDAFRRQTGPELRLEYELAFDTWANDRDEERRVVWTIACVNEGIGSARHVAIRYRDGSGLSDFHAHVPQPSCEATQYRKFTTCAFPAEVVIHPGATRALRRFYFKIRRDGSPAIRGPIGGREVLEFGIEIMAEGMRPLAVVLSLTRNEIADALRI